MYSNFDYNGELCHWEITQNDFRNNVEEHFKGKYYFKIDGRLYYIDLRCSTESYASEVFCRMLTQFNTGEDFYDDILIDNPEVEDREYSIPELRSLCEQFVEHYAANYEERIKKIESGRTLIDDNQWDEMNISSFEGKQEYLPWTMIDECGKDFKNERFHITAQTCPSCGSPIIKSKFCTSTESWRDMKGREGWIWFCPNCQNQLQCKTTRMN